MTTRAPLAAQAPAGTQKPQPPTFRTGVNFVRVDVIVSDKDGKAVTDLKQTDFDVTEDGKPQAVETFKYVQVSGDVAPGDPEPKEIRSEFDEESEAARDDVRLFAIFLDDYHVTRSSAMAIRSTLAGFIQKQIGPNDLVAIMYPLTPVSAVVMGRNRDTLLSAVQHFEGRKRIYEPRNEFEDKYAMAPVQTVEMMRNQVSLSALESLMVHMGALREGRKAVILVSEGFTNVVPPQLNDPIAGVSASNPLRGAANLGVDDRSAFFANLDIQNELRRVYDAANRSNTAIYALDPRGLATNEYDINENINQNTDRQMLQSTMDTLRVLSDQTDGRAIVNRNDLDGGLKQVVKDSSAYYLLGYNSTRTGADGKFHEIKVKVKRSGIQVRARKGYWALSKEEMAASTAPRTPSAPAAVTNALSTISEPRRGRYIRSWLGTTRGEGGKTRVTFVWEPMPPVPGLDQSQVAGVSIAALGKGDQAYYRGAVGKTGPADSTPAAPVKRADGTEAPPAPRGPSSVSFDVDPGNLQVRISVQDARGEVLDTDLRDFKIPDMTTPQVALGTPAVLRSANAREFQALNANPSAVPTASREFRRTERLLVRVQAFAPGTETATVSARVLNRGGNPMADIEARPPAETTPYWQIDLPLAGFAAGEYLIEVKAKAGAGEATELIPLKITS